MAEDHTPEDNPREVSSKEQRRQEGGALLITIVIGVIVLVAGAPCFCYFGLGLFQGVHVLRSGNPNNPARTPPRDRHYKRPAKYDRVFPQRGAPGLAPPERPSPPRPNAPVPPAPEPGGDAPPE